ncbi:hypothetical protein ACP70R_044484 [Stipagrostis hirtigluma subsp. patula]
MSGGSTNAVFYADRYHPIQAGSIDGTDVAPHDNAVLRALICSQAGLYDPFGDPKATGDPYCTVFVGRLSRQTDEEALRKAMSRYGRVKSMRLVRDIVTGASRGYAFVEYETDREMRRAYEDAHHSIIDGSEVIVDYYRQQLMPGWIPRRLGGGLGGKKESGQLRFGGRERPFRAPLRPIPYDELKKLGIPPPPEGRYMTRFQEFPSHQGVKVALSMRKIHLLGEDPGTGHLMVATEGPEVQLKMKKRPTGGKAAMTDGKNHKAEQVQDHPLPGRTAATAAREKQQVMTTGIIASREEAENRVKYLQRRRIGTEEKELQPNLVAALIGTVTAGITESTLTTAGSPGIETTGITVIVITPGEVRAEITVARFPVLDRCFTM